MNDLEVAALQRVLKSEGIKSAVPGGIRLTFIIVSKRINTRLASLATGKKTELLTMIRN